MSRDDADGSSMERLIYPLSSWDPAVRSRLAVAQVLANARWRELDVPPPPENGSDRTRKDLDDLLELQDRADERARRKTQIAEQRSDIISPFARALIRESELEDEQKKKPAQLPPRTLELAEGMKELVRYVIAYYKVRFSRPRPVQLEPKLRPMIVDPGHAAYPSGHSTQVHLIALVLSEVLPHARERLMEVALEVATNREWAGVHYRTDTEAGRDLARRLLELVKGPFGDAIQGAKEEWKAYSPLVVTAAAQADARGGQG
jgi:PAP2 superfamily